ncbi:MAG: hypothetical protein JKX76_04290 [Colwellia sp.]|nr:hypothetical protein [Colwellia sp.]
MLNSVLICPSDEGDAVSKIVKSCIPENARHGAQILHARAKDFERHVGKLVESMQDFHRPLKGLDYKLKTVDSLARKLKAEASKAGGLSKVTTPGDTLRYTFIVHKWLVGRTFIDTVTEVKKNLISHGYKVIKIDNSFINYSKSYDGVNCIFHDPKRNSSFEIQFHVPWSFWIKTFDHKGYEVIRVMPETTERERFLKKKANRFYDNEVRFGYYKEQMNREGFATGNVPHIFELKTEKSSSRSLAFG